jgi:hypothetical protein
MYSLTQKFVLCKLIVFLWVHGPLVASVNSNMEVVDSLLIGYFQEKTVGVISAADSVSIVCNVDDRDTRVYILQALGNFLVTNSMTVFRNYNPNRAFQGIVIEINNLNPRIEYSAPYNKSPVAAAYVRRFISIRITGQIYNAQNGQILNSLSSNLIYKDEVPADTLSNIDNSPFGFTVGIRTYSSKWDTYFEPVLIISAVGIIIYLFFSQRF